MFLQLRFFAHSKTMTPTMGRRRDLILIVFPSSACLSGAGPLIRISCRAGKLDLLHRQTSLSCFYGCPFWLSPLVLLWVCYYGPILDLTWNFRIRAWLTCLYPWMFCTNLGKWAVERWISLWDWGKLIQISNSAEGGTGKQERRTAGPNAAAAVASLGNLGRSSFCWGRWEFGRIGWLTGQDGETYKILSPHIRSVRTPESTCRFWASNIPRKHVKQEEVTSLCIWKTARRAPLNPPLKFSDTLAVCSLSNLKVSSQVGFSVLFPLLRRLQYFLFLLSENCALKWPL